MRGLLALFLILGLSFGSNAQKIDSFSITKQPDTSALIYIRVTFPNTHFAFSQYSYVSLNMLPSTSVLSVLFTECDNTTADTVFELQFPLHNYYLYDIFNVYVGLSKNVLAPTCTFALEPTVSDYKQYPPALTAGTAIRSPQANSPEVWLAPNPASSSVSLTNPGNHKLRGLRLYNMAGQLVLAETSGKGAVSVAGLPEGLYTAVIETDAGPVRQKLVIQR